mgnify:CR=1 FL=1
MIIDLLLKYRYLIIFPATIIEGPIVSVLSGFLLQLKYFELIPLYITIICADLTGDLLWYAVGHHWGDKFVKRFGKYVGITEEAIEKVKGIFHEHKNKFLFFSKVTMGFGFALATLITAGISRIPLKNFITFTALGQILWTAFLLSIGYFFGTFYLMIDKGFQTIGLITFIVLIILLGMGFNNYVKTLKIKKLS